MCVCHCILIKMVYGLTWVVDESCLEILLPIRLSLQMHLTQTTEHLWTKVINVFLAQQKGKTVVGSQSREVFSLLTWVSGWAGVTLGPPATTKVTAALWVGHHHAVPGLAADQAFINMQETHILVGCSAIWVKREDKKHEMSAVRHYQVYIKALSSLHNTGNHIQPVLNYKINIRLSK